MFEQFFTRPATIAHHHSSPSAIERPEYLSHMMEEGRSRNSLWIIAELLMSYAQHLPLHRAEVCASDIEISTEAWAKTRHRSASCLRVGKREFVFHGTKWLRLLGRLYEPQVEHSFALELSGQCTFPAIDPLPVRPCDVTAPIFRNGRMGQIQVKSHLNVPPQPTSLSRGKMQGRVPEREMYTHRQTVVVNPRLN